MTREKNKQTVEKKVSSLVMRIFKRVSRLNLFTFAPRRVAEHKRCAEYFILMEAFKHSFPAFASLGNLKPKDLQSRQHLLIESKIMFSRRIST